MWLSNVPKTRLVEGKRGHDWIKVKNDKFIFRGGEAEFPMGADKYLEQISQVRYVY